MSVTSWRISASLVNVSYSCERVFQLLVMFRNSSVGLAAWMYYSVTPGFRLRTMLSQNCFTPFFSSFNSS